MRAWSSYYFSVFSDDLRRCGRLRLTNNWRFARIFCESSMFDEVEYIAQRLFILGTLCELRSFQ
jgi:hypothetical protein